MKNPIAAAVAKKTMTPMTMPPIVPPEGEFAVGFIKVGSAGGAPLLAAAEAVCAEDECEPVVEADAVELAGVVEADDDAAEDDATEELLDEIPGQLVCPITVTVLSVLSLIVSLPEAQSCSCPSQ